MDAFGNFRALRVGRKGSSSIPSDFAWLWPSYLFRVLSGPPTAIGKPSVPADQLMSWSGTVNPGPRPDNSCRVCYQMYDDAFQESSGPGCRITSALPQLHHSGSIKPSEAVLTMLTPVFLCLARALRPATAFPPCSSTFLSISSPEDFKIHATWQRLELLRRYEPASILSR